MREPISELIPLGVYSTDIQLIQTLKEVFSLAIQQHFTLFVEPNLPSLKLSIQKNMLKLVLMHLDIKDEEVLSALTRFCMDYSEIPVIVIGSVSDPLVESKILELGAQDYWGMDQLKNIGAISRVRQVLRMYTAIRELKEERESFQRMIDSIRTGKISSIQVNAGKVRFLDTRLMEENEALLAKVEAQNVQLKELAHFDSLTGLPNRRQFEENISVELARAKRHRRLVAVFFLDLDKFKTVNDTFGHAIADSMLVEVANRLKDNIRKTDFIARIAGDEFAITLTDIKSTHEAGKIAQKLIDVLGETYYLDGKAVHLTASIGIACYPGAGEEAHILSKHADVAMYSAKQAGRNTYRYFSTDVQDTYSSRIQMENALRFALERQEFYLVYQPQVNLKNSEMIAMEVLIRWQNPQLGLVSPEKFIPIAEETGLISAIGEWVVDESFGQYAKWLAIGLNPKKLAINISPVQLLQKNLPRLLQSHLLRHAMDPSMVEIELTETVVMTYSVETQTVLEELHRLGVSIAIDDFGTGYSSLNHIRRLPLSVLKIDRSFVKDISNDPSAATIVKTVIALANSLELDVVAEGVETKAQATFLEQQGCSFAQGYYFSQPMVAEEMTAFLEKKL